jgi:hypothetical protein
MTLTPGDQSLRNSNQFVSFSILKKDKILTIKNGVSQGTVIHTYLCTKLVGLRNVVSLFY